MEIKLLKDQSVIIYPPKELIREWIVRIDIIRYNLQLIEYFYDTLLSKVNDKLNNKLANNIIILNDAWSIIENTHILFKFISNEIKEYENINIDLFDNIRLIRNTKQHLDSRIDKFDLSNHPFLGYITFAEIIGDNVKAYLLLGGYSMKDLKLDLPKSKGCKIGDLDQITLNSIDSKGNRISIDLIELKVEIEKFIEYFENRILRDMKEHNLEKFDWTPYRDLTLKLEA